MIYLASAVCFIFCVELALIVHLDKTLINISQLTQKAVSVVGSRAISDHWKEKVLPAYSLGIFGASIKLLFALVFIFAPAIILYWSADFIDPKLKDFLTSIWGIVFGTVFCVAYLWLRKSLVKQKTESKEEGEYSFTAKLLHSFALNSQLIREASFDIEQAVSKPKPEDIIQENHIFVSGLARAGTTLLMRLMHETNEFRSLTYRDMPFVMAPGLWRSLTGASHKAMREKERAHGDGVMVNFDSPEALEEVFWKTFCGKKYLFQDHLEPMRADEDEISDFRTYVATVLKSSSKPGIKRYLSKNNNNILRLSSIRESFPMATILIPVRDPLQQANSLISQHRLFSKQQAQDPFTKKYMTWLAHHEFGLAQRPFRFSDNNSSCSDKDKLDYWLELWIETYSYLLDEAPKAGAYFMCYEKLCQKSEKVLPELQNMLGAKNQIGAKSKLRLSVKEIKEPYDKALADKAIKLYEKLVEKSLG